MQTLNFIPPATITVNSVIGATLAFSLTAQHSDGTPFDLSGYTVTAPIVASQINGAEPPVPAFTVSVDAAIVTLSLDATQTGALGAAYLGTPIVWRWSVWLANEADRTELAPGELVLFRG